MAAEQIAFRFPYYVCRKAGHPQPLLVQLELGAVGLPLFYSEDDAFLFIDRTFKHGDISRISSSEDLLAFLESFTNVPDDHIFRVMFNPVDLSGNDDMVDVAEFIRALRHHLASG